MHTESKKEKKNARKKKDKSSKVQDTGNKSECNTSEPSLKECIVQEMTCDDNREIKGDQGLTQGDRVKQDDQAMSSDDEVDERKKQKDALVVCGGTFNDVTPQGRALKYLYTWKYDRANWKFSKKIQHWLVTNMFNSKMVPPEYFEMFKSHMAHCQGGIRQKLLKTCQNVFLQCQTSKNSSAAKHFDKNTNCRAQDLCKILKT